MGGANGIAIPTLSIDEPYTDHRSTIFFPIRGGLITQKMGPKKTTSKTSPSFQDSMVVFGGSNGMRWVRLGGPVAVPGDP